jgi:hypothetical protein
MLKLRLLLLELVAQRTNVWNLCLVAAALSLFRTLSTPAELYSDYPSYTGVREVVAAQGQLCEAGASHLLQS